MVIKTFLHAKFGSVIAMAKRGMLGIMRRSARNSHRYVVNRTLRPPEPCFCPCHGHLWKIRDAKPDRLAAIGTAAPR
ncbi:hypothetical protein [Rhodopseudomonas palustris]|uniref:hypothetical protein n=1 Tax=Rhodopseudomonas palustris TaxID=1076 RepID=UPI0012ED37A0